jgi:hypothetical protein
LKKAVSRQPSEKSEISRQGAKNAKKFKNGQDLRPQAPSFERLAALQLQQRGGSA